MSLSKSVQVDHVTVCPNGNVSVAMATVILENGVEISKTLHRHVIIPGSDYSAEDDLVRAICKAVQ